jgi:chemotaxis protein CheD
MRTFIAGLTSSMTAPMTAPTTKPIDVFLQPGEYFVGHAVYRIRTVLGSCVSMTLWSPLQGIGAMSHFMLASRGPAVGGVRLGLDAKYGDESLTLMLEELGRMKVQASDCQAKIFGGGDMFPGHKTSGALAVGRRNGEAARSLLRAHGIELISESLFGEGHRQIVFDVGSGHVWSRQLRPNTELVAAQESFE